MATARESKEKATELLGHYLMLASEGKWNGVTDGLSPDNWAELREIVNHIVDAAVIEMQVRQDARKAYAS